MWFLWIWLKNVSLVWVIHNHKVKVHKNAKKKKQTKKIANPRPSQHAILGDRALISATGNKQNIQRWRVVLRKEIRLCFRIFQGLYSYFLMFFGGIKSLTKFFVCCLFLFFFPLISECYFYVLNKLVRIATCSALIGEWILSQFCKKYKGHFHVSVIWWITPQ